MPKIIYVNSNGNKNEIDVENGLSVMEGAVQNNIPGIDPEVNQYGTGNAIGLDYFTNPQTQSTLLGVTFNF